MTLSEEALEYARSQLGVKETSPNSGPEVDIYIVTAGGHPEEPWCEAFAFTCFARAAARLDLVNPVPKTMSTLRMWKLAEPYCRDSNPSVGAVYVLKHSDTTGHVGIIEAIDPGTGIVTEISGNTFADRGGRAGNCVARHRGSSPEAIHGGELQGYLVFDRAAQAPPVA